MRPREMSGLETVDMNARGDSITDDYSHAAWVAETATRVARTCGAYPLLSSGDINIYSLFVERAMRLVKPEGMIGLLTPIGIGTDKTAARFQKRFGSETAGRLYLFRKSGWLAISRRAS